MRGTHALINDDMNCLTYAADPAISWDGEDAPVTELTFAACTFPGRGRVGPSGFFTAALKVPTYQLSIFGRSPQQAHLYMHDISWSPLMMQCSRA